MGKGKRKKTIPKESITTNIRLLSEQDLSSFISWMVERRMALGEDVLQWLEPEEIEQVDAVIFNGLVDAYILGMKKEVRFFFIGMPKNCKVCTVRERSFQLPKPYGIK